MAIPWTGVKGIVGWIFAAAIIVLISFNIVTLLPIATNELEHDIEAVAATLLFVGAILRAKLYTGTKIQNQAEDDEWKRVFRAALALSVFGGLISLVVFAMTFSVHGPWTRKFYFGSMTAFILSVIIPPHTLTTFDDRQENSWSKKIAYIIDRYLVALYAVALLHINFLEAKEALGTEKMKRAHKKESLPFNFSLSSSSSTKSKDTNQFYECYHGLKTAAYAILTELLGLLFMCHIEQRRLRNNIATDHRQIQETNIATSDENRHQSSASCSESDRNNGNVSKTDSIVFALGLLSLTPLIFVIIVHSTGGVGQSIALQDQIVFCLTTFYISFTVYQIVLLWFLPSRHSVDYDRVSNSLDTLLLRWSAYGILLFICLVIAALICDPTNRVSSLIEYLLEHISNALQVCWQYAILINLFVLVKNRSLEEGSKKLRFYATPIFLANAFMWIYDLWQWRSVTFLTFGDARLTPGPVWEMMEAMLFPPAIFFRFHSAFLTFMFFGFEPQKWIRKISRVCGARKQTSEETNCVSSGNVDWRPTTLTSHSEWLNEIKVIKC